MSETAIVPAQVEEAKAEVAPVLAAAHSLTVGNVEEHDTAMRMLGQVMAAERRVKLLFAPSIEAAQESKRKAELARIEVVALRDSVLASVTEAREVISRKCASFEEEERRVARLNQHRINAEALAAQEQQRILDAAMAPTEEEAEEALTEPLPPPVVPIIRPEVAKVAGVTSREIWSAEVYDRSALFAHSSKPGNDYLAEPNMVALNSRARAEHGAMRIPGVRAVSAISHAAR